VGVVSDRVATKGGKRPPAFWPGDPCGAVPGCTLLETDQIAVVETVGYAREAGCFRPSGSGAFAHDEGFAPDARAGSVAVGSRVGPTTPPTERVVPPPWLQKGSHYPSKRPGEPLLPINIPKDLLDRTSRCGVEGSTGQQIAAGLVGDCQRITVASVPGPKLSLEVGRNHFVGSDLSELQRGAGRASPPQS
jgi:hypothetical protein